MADDYDGGLKHLAALATGTLSLTFFVVLIASVGVIAWRWMRRWL